MPRRLGALLAITCVLAGGATAHAGREGFDRQDAIKFDSFQLFWLGDRLGRFKLAEILGGEDRVSTDWSFLYGRGSPVEVQSWSACKRWAGIYPGEPDLFPFRGAQAAWVPTAGSFEIYTGRTTVVVFARSRGLARKAAKAVRPVRSMRPVHGLDPPAPGSLTGGMSGCPGGKQQPAGPELPVPLP